MSCGGRLGSLSDGWGNEHGRDARVTDGVTVTRAREPVPDIPGCEASWGGLLMPATVLMNTGGIATTNCFLVADEAAKVAVLFDAPDHTAGPLLEEAAKRGWDLIGLWLTHGHFDHMLDHVEVGRRF